MGDSEPNVVLSWATPVAGLVVVTLGAIGFAVAATLSGDPVGVLLLGLAAVLSAAVAGLGWLRRPRLSVAGGKLLVRGLRGTHGYIRADLDRVRVVRYPRLGRRVPMLEIDVREPEPSRRFARPEQLLVFGRWDLGTDPADVFDALSVQGLVPAEH